MATAGSKMGWAIRDGRRKWACNTLMHGYYAGVNRVNSNRLLPPPLHSFLTRAATSPAIHFSPTPTASRATINVIVSEKMRAVKSSPFTVSLQVIVIISREYSPQPHPATPYRCAPCSCLNHLGGARGLL